MRALVKISTAILICCIASTAARADIIINNSPGGGNPDENILFNGAVGAAGGFTGPGQTIQGVTNQSGLLLDIMSGTGGPNLFGSGGAAMLTAENGVPFGAAGVMFGDGDFDFITDFKFNVNAIADGSLTIDVFDDEAGNTLLSSATFDLDKNGQNWFRITGTGGDDFAKVTITANGDIIGDIRQIRISGGANDGDNGDNIVTIAETPEPASILLWCLLASAVGVFLVRRRRTVSAFRS